MHDLRSFLKTADGEGREALERLSAEMYSELRALAHARLRRSERMTLLDTTALVHDSYIRLVKAGQIAISSRGEFMAYAARVMRSVIVDLVRERGAERRGGEQLHVTLNTEVAESVAVDSEQMIRVHDALTDLEKIDPRLVQIVELRFFGGLSDGEIAQYLGIADRTVRRNWEKAKLMLGAALR
jgi:RNA polymerase sigma factor (TIGR02999 family)